MKQKTPKQQAYLFFLRNAGYSYDPKTETKQAGRSRCARQLAKAERDAAALGFTFEWQEDDIFASHGHDEHPNTCEVCFCLDGDKVLASLGCIDDATREYRRVIEAELALEAL